MVGCSLFAACIRFAFAILRGLDEKSRHVWGTLSSLARFIASLMEAACDEDETCETCETGGDGDGDGDDDAYASCCKKHVNRKPHNNVKGANMKPKKQPL